MWKRVLHIMLHLKKYLPQNKIEIYTDGTSKAGIGAWAFVLVQNNKVIQEKSGRLKKAGNHQMEFQAAIEALQKTPPYSKITLYSDSRILIDTFTKKERPSLFDKQIKELETLCQKRTVTWKWIKSHSGIIHNERCDELCAQARS